MHPVEGEMLPHCPILGDLIMIIRGAIWPRFHSGEMVVQIFLIIINGPFFQLWP